MCGGTFLWVRALVLGLAPAPPADEAVRARHAEAAERLGRAALHAELAKVDPASAARLAPNDLVRVSRALEVHELTGRPLAAWHAEHGFRETKHRARYVGVARARDELDARIEARVKGFFERGFVEEVRALLDAGLGGARAMGSVGYKQVAEHVRGELRASELHGAVVRATRVFVRRQRTWLREEAVAWVDLER